MGKSSTAPKLSATPTPISTTPTPAQPSPRKGPDTVDSFVPDLGDFDNFLSEDNSLKEEKSLQDGEASCDDEDVELEVKKPQNDLDDFSSDSVAQPGDYE